MPEAVISALGHVDTKEERTLTFTWTFRYLGVSLALLSGACTTLAMTLLKLMHHYSVFSLATWRFLGLLFPSILLVVYETKYKKKEIFEPIHPLHKKDKLRTLLLLLLRVFFGCLVTLLRYKSLEYMTAADVIVISSTTPIFVEIMAHAFLGEEFGIYHVLATFLTLLGVTIVARPPFLLGTPQVDSSFLLGTGLALGATLCRSSLFLILRALRSVHYSVTSLFYGTFGFLECAILAVLFNPDGIEIPEGAWDWFLALAFVSLFFGSQVWATLALKYEEAGTISLCRTTDIVLSFIWQFIILQTIPDHLSLVGSAVIALGVLLVTFRQYLLHLPHHHYHRRLFQFILR